MVTYYLYSISKDMGNIQIRLYGNILFVFHFKRHGENASLCLHLNAWFNAISTLTEFGDTNGVIRSCISKDRPCKGQMTVRKWSLFIAKWANTEVRVMVFNATFNNISVILWILVQLMEDTGENYQPAASH
jgi:hypothetical protein